MDEFEHYYRAKSTVVGAVFTSVSTMITDKCIYGCPPNMVGMARCWLLEVIEFWC